MCCSVNKKSRVEHPAPIYALGKKAAWNGGPILGRPKKPCCRPPSLSLGLADQNVANGTSFDLEHSRTIPFQSVKANEKSKACFTSPEFLPFRTNVASRLSGSSGLPFVETQWAAGAAVSLGIPQREKATIPYVACAGLKSPARRDGYRCSR